MWAHGPHYDLIRCAQRFLICDANGYRLGERKRIMAKPQDARRKHSPIKVHCLPNEKAKIEAKAKNCSMSVSHYLRDRGMGYRPKSILDADAVIELAKVNADQGRLGGLLKMWLTNDERLDAMGKDNIQQTILILLDDIKKNQERMLEAVQKV